MHQRTAWNGRAKSQPIINTPQNNSNGCCAHNTKTTPNAKQSSYLRFKGSD
uniref:Uncharacterized protein n=1 Tax=Arundo donax TaxID=35708 RepID=A0A0A9BQN1_ARUDO